MKEYLAQWQYLDGSGSEEYFDREEIAKSMVCRRITLMGGIGYVTRVRDSITVYRLWNLKEDDAINVAA